MPLPGFTKRLRKYYRWRIKTIAKRTAGICDRTVTLITPYSESGHKYSHLIRCIESVKNQARHNLQVIHLIVGNSGLPSIDTNNLPDWYSIEQIATNQPEFNEAAMRNFGMQQINRGWILFLDSACQLEPDAFRNISLEISAKRGAIIFRVVDETAQKTVPAGSDIPTIGDVDSLCVLMNSELKQQTLWQPKKENAYFFIQNLMAMSTHYGNENYISQAVIGRRLTADNQN